jgi:hypothetical protein
MTIRMYDSVTVDNLPAGNPAYLGYVNGRFPTFAALKTRFPHSHLLDLTVFSNGEATGCDVENGDMSVSQAIPWVKNAIARGVYRPVIYANAGTMVSVGLNLQAAGIGRMTVRLLSAHYQSGVHICSPNSCAYTVAGHVVPSCDGTQWRDNAPGNNGTLVDESILDDAFFAPKPQPPIAVRKAGEMILVTIDRTTVPEGTPWPGVFLVGSGAIHHVTSPKDEDAYKAAGIPGPVSISYSEYQSWAGPVT